VQLDKETTSFVGEPIVFPVGWYDIYNPVVGFVVDWIVDMSGKWERGCERV
jgi:hypothetical protein